MPILVFQHGDHLGPGRLGATLRDTGYVLDIRRPDLSPATVPADLDNIQGIVIFGGEQNVTDIAQYQWMQAEAELIRKAHAAALPIVGICLGAQLIAHALGGKVVPKATPDCGFKPLRINTTGQTEAMLAGINWKGPQLFVCGQEVQEPAPGTIVFASTDTTKIAAYKAGLRTYGFLFHFECDGPMLAEITGHACGVSAKSAGQNGNADSHASMHATEASEYSAFARSSDRLCVNIATLLFPLRRRVMA